MPRVKKPSADLPVATLTPEVIDRSSDIGPQIYELLRLSIILNELKPGMVVNEGEICALFGVSRTPIREAYKMLIADGLIKTTSKVGSAVTEIDDRRVREGIIIRRALEREVIEVLCHNKADLSQLDATLALQQVAVNHNDQTMFFKEDEKFHALLAKLAGLPTAWALAHSVKAHADRVRVGLNRGDPQRMINAFAQHQALVSALRARDKELSLQMITTHINAALVPLENL